MLTLGMRIYRLPYCSLYFRANAVFYASILNFPSTLLIFVFGTLFISGDQGKMKFKWDTLYCPAMIASYLSILIVATGWIPPKVISTPLTLLGNMTVPSALLIIGSSIAQIPIRRMLGTSNIYITAILRLFAIPLFILYLSRLYHVEPAIANINVILAAMPVASYGTLFCIQYEKRRNYHGTRYIYNNTAISFNDTASYPLSIKSYHLLKKEDYFNYQNKT